MALLHEGPMHPYEIACTMRHRRMEESIKLNYGSLYHTVESLQRDGLIEPAETEREGRRPERTVYALTETGRIRFMDRLSSMIRYPTREYPHFEAGLCFLSQMEPSEANDLLRARAATIEREIENRRAELDRLRQRGLSRLSLIDAEFDQAIRMAELNWIRTLTEDIEAGRIEWRAGIRPCQPDNEEES
jgi:DNA-binding PadR family transcriptional regulator